MLTITAKLRHDSFVQVQLATSVAEILAATELMAMASVDSVGGGHVNTAYFAFDALLRVYFISDENTQHCLNIARNPAVSGAVWCMPAKWGEGLRGVQLFGRCARATGETATGGLQLYKGRFPQFAPAPTTEEAYVTGTGKSGLFVIDIQRVKLLDEPRFGRRNFIEVAVVR